MNLESLKNPNVINLFHVIFVSGLLLVLAYDKFPENIVSKTNFLIGLAIFVALYHLWKIHSRMKLEKQANSLLKNN